MGDYEPCLVRPDAPITILITITRLIVNMRPMISSESGRNDGPFSRLTVPSVPSCICIVTFGVMRRSCELYPGQLNIHYTQLPKMNGQTRLCLDIKTLPSSDTRSTFIIAMSRASSVISPLHSLRIPHAVSIQINQKIFKTIGLGAKLAVSTIHCPSHRPGLVTGQSHYPGISDLGADHKIQVGDANGNVFPTRRPSVHAIFYDYIQ